MATVIVMLRKDAPKKDGTFPIIIRLVDGRKKTEYSIGYSVKEIHFINKEGNWVDGKRNQDAAIINALIQKKLSEVNLKIVKAQFSDTPIEDQYAQPKNEVFYDLISKEQLKYEERNQVVAWTRTRARLNNLKEAWNDKKVTVSELSKYWVELYKTKRLSLHKSPNTIRKDLSFFSSILVNSKCSFKENFFVIERNKTTKVPVDKRKLTHLEIQTLENATLFGNEDAARDVFLFMYYCQGMRISNAIEFKRAYINNGIIRYQMGKGHKWMEVVIIPPLQKIIDKYYAADTPYLFSFLKELLLDDPETFKEIDYKTKVIDSQATLIRTWLKRVAFICGITTKLSPHIARHTFAQHLRMSGASTFTAKDALGHSDVRTTEDYMAGLDYSMIQEASVKAFNAGAFNGKRDASVNYCSGCGTKRIQEAKFCVNCGEKLV